MKMSNTSITKLHDVIGKITDKLVEIVHYINEYEEIFNDNKKTKNIIAATNCRFFDDLYSLYWNFLTIRICALLDTSKTFGNKNLSIKLLIELVEKENLPCRKKVNELLNKIDLLIASFKNSRNKAFTHFDLDIMLSKKRLEMLKLDDLILTIGYVSEIVNIVNSDLGKDVSLFGMKSHDGARRLIGILEMGMKHKEQIINQAKKNIIIAIPFKS